MTTSQIASAQFFSSSALPSKAPNCLPQCLRITYLCVRIFPASTSITGMFLVRSISAKGSLGLCSGYALQRWRCIRISWKAAPASCWNSPPILNNSRNNLTTRIVKQLGHVHEIESRSVGWKENRQWLCWPRFQCRRSLCEAWFQGCDSKIQEMLDYWFEAIACRKCGISHLEYICWAIAGSTALREGMTFRTQLVLAWAGLRAGPQEWTSLTSP